jgi:hypothetical protein
VTRPIFNPIARCGIFESFGGQSFNPTAHKADSSFARVLIFYYGYFEEVYKYGNIPHPLLAGGG